MKFKIKVRNDASTPWGSIGFMTLSTISVFSLTFGNFISMPINQEKMARCVIEWFPHVNNTTIVGGMAVVGMILKFIHGEIYTPRGWPGPNPPRGSRSADQSGESR